ASFRRLNIIVSILENQGQRLARNIIEQRCRISLTKQLVLDLFGSRQTEVELRHGMGLYQP
ncbi:MAG: hypothetical protein ACLR31_22275, partial [Escherichia coli]